MLKKLFSRLYWLYTSADLTFAELILVLANKLIFISSRLYYFLVSILLFRDTKVFYNYSRHIPRGMKIKGNCLVAYLPEVVHKEYFLGNVKFYFSNNGAPLAVLKALNELGYSVDIIHYNYLGFIPKKNYDVFFFHQYDIYNALKNKLNKNIKSVLFETTAFYKPMVSGIRNRIDYFKNRHGIELPEEQFNHFLWMEKIKEKVESVSRNVDGVVVMGDQLAGSFKQLENKNIKLIKSAVYFDNKITKDLTLENLEKGRKKFLFFGGGTDVMRKGLDILLDVFIGSEYELYMCINLPPIFEDKFKVSQQKNIVNLGYLKVGSKKFYEIVNTCNYIIQPAVAEGVPGGVLENMKYGLMPIVSQECNIPEASEIGFLLPEVTVESVRESLQTITSLPVLELQNKAKKTIEVIKNTYTPDNFVNDIKVSVKEIVQN